MKSWILSFTVIMLAQISARADFQAFSKEAFEASQKNNEKILLHFHADWCPTCKAQVESYKKLESEGALKGITLYRVDYDKETDFKKALHVTHQSTVIAFYGALESGRQTGSTSVEDLQKFDQDKLIGLTLKDQLQLMKDASASKIPEDKRKIMDAATDKLRASQLKEKALKVGAIFPAFKLMNSGGQSVELKKLLKSGPVIISFYRGSWCPYCNAQLASYQQHLADFKNRGAILVAVTPEKPELEVLLKEGKKLEFDILHDKDNKIAKKLGLVYGITDELKSLYQQFGIDLAKTQGNEAWELPVPATYVIGKNGKIAYEFIDVDYTKRADPNDILAALDQLK